jgi:hypothetical protein
VSKTSENRGAAEEGIKRRKVASSSKHESESSTSSDETLSAPPCLVTFNTGVRIVKVAAGGRHTLALSGTFVAPINLYAHVLKYKFIKFKETQQKRSGLKSWYSTKHELK